MLRYDMFLSKTMLAGMKTMAPEISNLKAFRNKEFHTVLCAVSKSEGIESHALEVKLGEIPPEEISKSVKHANTALSLFVKSQKTDTRWLNPLIDQLKAKWAFEQGLENGIPETHIWDIVEREARKEENPKKLVETLWRMDLETEVEKEITKEEQERQ